MKCIAIAQIDLCVGDIAGNTQATLDYINEAKTALSADTVIFPELTLTGYPPEDLLLRPGFHAQVEQAIRQIIDNAIDINIILGHTSKKGDALYNSCSLIKDKKLITSYHKCHLPNYGVFDEKRYFTAGNDLNLIETASANIALSVCEDLWTEEHIGEAVANGAEMLININASPYHADKANVRERLLEDRVNRYGIMDSNGHLVFKAPQFEQGLYAVELNRDNGVITFTPRSSRPPTLGYEESIYSALVLGVKDYVLKNGFKGAVIGLSGGIDSALTLAIAVDALGADNVDVLMMPSRYTSDMSIEDAQAVAANLNVNHHTISIEKPLSAFFESLSPIFKDLPVDTTEENIQARCRGILLMAISNKTGKLVLTTGNKSEMAVGYATLYGDMAGGFAPLKDVPKTLAYKLATWRNTDEQIIPQRIIDRPPSAELRFDQKDEDSLPGYDVLDPILEKYIEQDLSPDEIIKDGFDKKTVHDIVARVDKNEYKRRQAAPGVRITERAFGRDRRYPVTSRYRET